MRLSIQETKKAPSGAFSHIGGGCEIRTHGGLTSPAVFKTAGLNRSPKPPADLYFNLCEEQLLQIAQKIQATRSGAHMREIALDQTFGLGFVELFLDGCDGQACAI
jgi:hypothetical protein